MLGYENDSIYKNKAELYQRQLKIKYRKYLLLAF
jgi:hypothetical protein